MFMAKARHQGQGRGAAPTNDLSAGNLPKRPAAMTRILDAYERFVKVRPEQAEALLEGCRAITERYRTPSTVRRLSCREAASRIGVSRNLPFYLYQQGRLGECIDGRPRFSERECDDYKTSNRMPGPKPKPSPERGDSGS